MINRKGLEIMNNSEAVNTHEPDCCPDKGFTTNMKQRLHEGLAKRNQNTFIYNKNKELTLFTNRK